MTGEVVVALERQYQPAFAIAARVSCRDPWPDGRADGGQGVSALGTKLRRLEGGQVMFRCPGCKSAHAVGVEAPAPLIWGFNGNGDAPTFTTPSIFVNAPASFIIRARRPAIAS